MVKGIEIYHEDDKGYFIKISKSFLGINYKVTVTDDWFETQYFHDAQQVIEYALKLKKIYENKTIKLLQTIKIEKL